MSKEKIFNVLSVIDISQPEFSLEKSIAKLNEFLAKLEIENEEGDLFKSILFSLCCASSVKNEVVKILKGRPENADLSASLLVDIDSRYELLLAHCIWLIDNREIGSEFSLKLGSGARLSEEFFSEIVFRVSKLQRTLDTELGALNSSTRNITVSNLIKNMNAVNTYLSELLGKLPRRYDLLATGLLGV